MEIIALEGQSFLDIAIQGGSLENILKINPNISITDEPVIGNNYNVAIENAPISNYYQRNKIEPATFHIHPIFYSFKKSKKDYFF